MICARKARPIDERMHKFTPECLEPLHDPSIPLNAEAQLRSQVCPPPPRSTIAPASSNNTSSFWYFLDKWFLYIMISWTDIPRASRVSQTSSSLPQWRSSIRSPLGSLRRMSEEMLVHSWGNEQWSPDVRLVRLVANLDCCRWCRWCRRYGFVNRK